MKKKLKSVKRSKVTIEKLAEMNQREFVAIRGEMAEIRTELKGDIHTLRSDMEAGFQGVGQTLKTILEQLRAIREDVIELHDLRARIERVEKKIGLRP